MKDIFIIKLLQYYFNRLQSESNYFEFQKFQADHVVSKIRKVFDVDYDCQIIDYGCGIGGYSYVLAEQFKQVLAVDYFKNLNETRDNIIFKQADLLHLETEPGDLIFCASVIEHIPTEKKKLFVKNLNRNLKTGGYVYLSFPPFFSINGGHVVAPFHFFPDKIAFFLLEKFRGRKVISYEQMFGDWGLYKTSIQEVKHLLQTNGFKIIEIGSRYFPSFYSKIFGQVDFLNWHAEFYCQKL